MVKLNKNVLKFEWENKMNKMNKMDKVILFLYAILAVYMLITSLLSKKRHFNNEKYLTIFKDSVAILIIPLLTNLLSDNKLATNQFIAYLVLIIALIGLYLFADWQFIPNKTHVITKVKINNMSNNYSSANILHMFKIITIILFFWIFIFITPIMILFQIFIRKNYHYKKYHNRQHM